MIVGDRVKACLQCDGLQKSFWPHDTGEIIATKITEIVWYCVRWNTGVVAWHSPIELQLCGTSSRSNKCVVYKFPATSTKRRIRKAEKIIRPKARKDVSAIEKDKVSVSEE